MSVTHARRRELAEEAAALATARDVIARCVQELRRLPRAAEPAQLLDLVREELAVLHHELQDELGDLEA